jgi:hypothetical protein
MKLENLDEVKRTLLDVRRYLSNLDTYLNDFNVNKNYYNAMLTDMNSAITDTIMMCDKVADFDVKRKRINELIMLKSVYRYNSDDKRFYLDLDLAYSINEFEDYHIYELTTKRKFFTDVEDDDITDFDYINKILILCDFDREHCYDKETIEIFDDMITDNAIDLDFSNFEYCVRQIS